MEHNDPSQRPYAPNPYATPQTQPSGGQLSGQFGAPTSNERYRSTSFVQQSPTAASPAGRVGSDGQQLYTYPPSAPYGAVQAVPNPGMSYMRGMQAPETQRQVVQPPTYASYGGNIMYAVAQPPPPQTPTDPAYAPVPPYRPRPSPGSETLPTQFGVPPPAQYYLATQAGPAGAPAADLAPPQMPPQYSAAAYPPPAPSVPPGYPAAMMEPPQPASYEGPYPQQPPYVPAGVPSVDQGFNEYQARIRSVFSSVHAGVLRDVGPQLLQVSQYLLGNAEALGLTRDEENSHDDHLRIWEEFNRAWLSSLQRQFDMTEEFLRTGQPLREPQSLMNTPTLEQLSRELVRLCDGVEKFGLVDYQMGVAEEEIMDLMIRCLSQLDGRSQEPAGPATTEPSATASSRAR